MRVHTCLHMCVCSVCVNAYVYMFVCLMMIAFITNNYHDLSLIFGKIFNKHLAD